MGLLNKHWEILERTVNQAQKKGEPQRSPPKILYSLPGSLFLAGAAALVSLVEFLNPTSSIHKQLLPCVERVRS